MALIDAFPLFNELDILEIRLAELYPVVDKFILVEATRTHKGDPKPLYYAESRQRFAGYNDKIIHVVVGDMPTGDGLPAIRRRELWQRNGILQGLRDASDDDLVLVSDADEIPRRECVAAFHGQTLPDGLIVTFIQRLSYYNLNTAAPDRPWPGTRLARCADVRALTPHIIRNGIGQPDAHYPQHAHMQHGGWHLSYLGDAVHIQHKMRSFLHQELVTTENTGLDAIAARIAAGEDLWGRTDEQQFIIGPTPDLPVAIRSDPMHYAQYFHPDWRPQFTDDWYPAEQAQYLGYLAQQAPEGAIVEIGCWEGRSTVALAQAVTPRIVHAVDHWRGNEDEQEAKDEQANDSVTAARERDVWTTFVKNMERLTAWNYTPHKKDWRDWIKTWDGPIAFLHLDASHDYVSVRDCLCAVLPFLVPGALVCGDDGYADGVYRATRDVLGAAVKDMGGRLWVWQKEAE